MSKTIAKSPMMFFYPFVVVGIALVVLLPPAYVLGLNYPRLMLWGDTTSNSMLINLIAFYFSGTILRRFENFPQKNSWSFIFPITLSSYAIVIAIVLILRLLYSVKIILMGLFLTLTLMIIQNLVIARGRRINFAVVPFGEALEFKDSEHYRFERLTSTQTPLSVLENVVADLHDDALPAEWERFLSQCALQRIPVYNAMQLKENITGQVNVKHLIANNFGDLSPSFFHQNFKRIIDVIFLVLVSPIIIPIMLAIGVWISFDSPGGPFFVQPRMGLGGKWFNVIKFRSMYINHKGSHFTEKGEDHRITRVGKIIRKYRLDELPQFWNVLKGEMSLIGPRPESAELAKWYDNEVPFFAYRHVVRPGISGWAQVMHGYAAGVDDMKDKLSYDFYYIKHFSLWLDLLIWYKTIRTVLTGFGSR